MDSAQNNTWHIVGATLLLSVKVPVFLCLMLISRFSDTVVSKEDKL